MRDETEVRAELIRERLAKLAKPMQVRTWPRRSWESIDARAENDLFVEEMYERERKEAAKKRLRLWRDVTPRAETIFDRIREGRQ